MTSKYAFESCWCCGSETICRCKQDWSRCKECSKCPHHHKPDCIHGQLYDDPKNRHMTGEEIEGQYQAILEKRKAK